MNLVDPSGENAWPCQPGSSDSEGLGGLAVNRVSFHPERPPAVSSGAFDTRRGGGADGRGGSGALPLTPGTAMTTAQTYLVGKWKHCLDLFSDQEYSDFKYSDFAETSRKITWIDTRGKPGERTVHSYTGNGSREALSDFVGR